MVREEFARVLYTSRTRIIEPGWKMLLSNKGILPLLWQRYPNHPNLLPAFFEDEANAPLSSGWVRKPLFSREGANIQLVDREGQRLEVDGPYGDGRFIRQEFSPLPKFYDEDRGQDVYALVGSWVVGDCSAGIGMREDSTLVTKDSSRFVPHIILD
jgi:glutathionylspermidine synthase